MIPIQNTIATYSLFRQKENLLIGKTLTIFTTKKRETK